MLLVVWLQSYNNSNRKNHKGESSVIFKKSIVIVLCVQQSRTCSANRWETDTGMTLKNGGRVDSDLPYIFFRESF